MKWCEMYIQPCVQLCVLTDFTKYLPTTNCVDLTKDLVSHPNKSLTPVAQMLVFFLLLFLIMPPWVLLSIETVYLEAIWSMICSVNVECMITFKNRMKGSKVIPLNFEKEEPGVDFTFINKF